MTREELAAALKVDQFPRAAHFEPEWMCHNEMGPNAVWLMEYLTQAMRLKPGMRVLDMGCGRALSSIFLAKEFGVQVWANDLWISATDNWQRIREAGMEELVYPIHAEAHALPYAEEFFDAIVSVDAYHYFGTDEKYFLDFVKLLKPEGQIGIVAPGFFKELAGGIPDALRPVWNNEFFTFHSSGWWRRHWEKTGLVEILTADVMPDGWGLWMKWLKVLQSAGFDNPRGDMELLTADAGKYLAFPRLVARRR